MIRIRPILMPCILIVGCAPLGPSINRQSLRSGVHPVAVSVSPVRPAAPELKRLQNGRYRVRKPWAVDLKGRRWEVSAGYSTNGITAPALVKNSLGDGVQHPETWAAVFHDWLFKQPGISRSQADELFYDLLIAYGVPAAKAKVMYTSVAAYSLAKRFR